MIEASLAITSCDKLYFVSFHTDNIDEDAYKFQMLRLNRDLGLQTKVVNHQAWANMCFFQFLYLTIVNCSSEIVDFFLTRGTRNLFVSQQQPQKDIFSPQPCSNF